MDEGRTVTANKRIGTDDGRRLGRWKEDGHRELCAGARVVSPIIIIIVVRDARRSSKNVVRPTRACALNSVYAPLSDSGRKTYRYPRCSTGPSFVHVRRVFFKNVFPLSIRLRPMVEFVKTTPVP